MLVKTHYYQMIFSLFGNIIFYRIMCTSLQSIIASGNDIGQQQDIEQLFKYKEYPRFQLREFYSHPLYQQNEQFHFFIDILEEWNRKTDLQQLCNSSNTLYYKNVYIYNNLRTAILQLPQNVHLVLQKLSHWYNRTRNNKIRVIEKKQEQNKVDQAWQIRNTFKSNLPAQIDLYRRRLFWDFSDKQNQQRTKPTLKGMKNRKIKTEMQNTQNTKRELQQKRLIKIQNENVRFERERNQLVEVEARWKVKKAREEEFMVKNFYNGNFSTNKTYFSKKQKIETQMARPILRKAHTSAGFRNSKSQNRNRFSQTGITQSKITNRKSQVSSDKFDEFEINEVRLSDIAGLNLLINPFQKKLKKKKRRR